jgi:hypothetical protein
MVFLVDLFKNFFSIKNTQPKTGPNTLEELLTQFDNPKKEKTNEDIISDYTILQTIQNLEVEMLRKEPVRIYKGSQRWKDSEGNLYFDWIPCAVRPEVIYCSYGKS